MEEKIQTKELELKYRNFFFGIAGRVRPRLHDAGKIREQNKTARFRPCVYTIPAEKCYETVMKSKRSPCR